MPVKIYVGRDIQKFTHYPDASHEASAMRRIGEYLWDVWHHQSSRHYAIVANPKQTKTGRELSADLVIISELGIGVVDLKEYYGEIKCGKPGEAWRAGPLKIKAGSDSKGYANPHEQVQAYAGDIRTDLVMTNSFPGEPWEREKFKVHTAVCFTNPDARIANCQKAIQKKPWQDTLERWEKFAILSYKDIRDWGADLRFDVSMGEAYGFRQYSWTPEQVHNLATDFFGARLWREMQASMPVGQPLAYLTVLEDGQSSQVFNVAQDMVKLGRAPESHIVIPIEYETVSRHHAVITRTIDGFIIEDRSKNGTFVNNRRLHEGEACPLEENDIILLGGLKDDKMVCCLKFSRKAPPPSSTTFAKLQTIE